MTSPQAQATATDAAGRHEPVLLQRCLDLLAPAVEGRRRHVPAEEVGAAEDEQSHADSPAEPLPRRPAGSRRANRLTP